MSTWSRRDLLRVSGAAAVAVPMGVLSRNAAAAATTSSGTSSGTGDGDADGVAGLFEVGHEPVMFCVHDAKLGEVAILHGTDEVVVKDPALVRRVLRAASRQKL